MEYDCQVKRTYQGGGKAVPIWEVVKEGGWVLDKRREGKRSLIREMYVTVAHVTILGGVHTERGVVGVGGVRVRVRVPASVGERGSTRGGGLDMTRNPWTKKNPNSHK